MEVEKHVVKVGVDLEDEDSVGTTPRTDWFSEIECELESDEVTTSVSNDVKPLVEVVTVEKPTISNSVSVPLDTKVMEQLMKKYDDASVSRSKVLRAGAISPRRYRKYANDILDGIRSAGTGKVVRLDESKTICSDLHYQSMRTSSNKDEVERYCRKRSLVVASLYSKLGLIAENNEINKFGSLHHIARQAYLRREEWGVTGVTKWLNSIKKLPGKWEGDSFPYNDLLRVIPQYPGRILDYGCGSGLGADQLKQHFGLSQSQIDCYDSQGDTRTEISRRNIQFVTHVAPIYDVVTMVNVLHHVYDAESVLFEAMSGVIPGGRLIIKDHFVDDTNSALMCLVHEMYDQPKSMHDDVDPLYVRSIRALKKYFFDLGWVVTEIPNMRSDIGDVVLEFRNVVGTDHLRIAKLEDKILTMQTQLDELHKYIQKNVSTVSVVSGPVGAGKLISPVVVPVTPASVKMKVDLSAIKRNASGDGDPLSPRKPVSPIDVKVKEKKPPKLKKNKKGKEVATPVNVVKSKFKYVPVEITTTPTLMSRTVTGGNKTVAIAECVANLQLRSRNESDYDECYFCSTGADCSRHNTVRRGQEKFDVEVTSSPTVKVKESRLPIRQGICRQCDRGGLGDHDCEDYAY